MSSLGQHSAAPALAESEQEAFFRVLLHDDRNSFYFISTDAGGAWSDTAVSRTQLSAYPFNLVSNYYVTHNGFTEKRRRTERTRQLNALFFDLDCHEASQNESDRLVQAALIRLEEAWSCAVLPEPTLIVESGRGIHLYYVLERSVPFRFRGQGNVNEKGIAFFQRVQRQLADVIEEQLKGLDGIHVDRAVFDHTRVSRIPGTYNRKAGRFACLKHVNEAYHQLSDLAAYKPQAQPQLPSSKRPAKILSFHPLMMSRLNKIVELQAYRQYDCEGSRELMSFVYYNTAVQVYSRDDAKERLDAFNSLFKKPLPASEITGIVHAVDSVVNVKGEKGHYILSASKLIELLSLTKEEMDNTFFFASKRMTERLEAKRKTKAKRDERNAMIVELYSYGEMTQQEVANAVGCSLRTVQTVLKEASMTRTRTAPKPAPEETQPERASFPWVNIARSWDSPISGAQCAKNWQPSQRSEKNRNAAALSDSLFQRRAEGKPRVAYSPTPRFELSCLRLFGLMRSFSTGIRTGSGSLAFQLAARFSGSSYSLGILLKRPI